MIRLPAGGTYVVGVSGGIDSAVLLALLVQHGRRPIVAHVDHGIRPESVADARFVAGLAAMYKLPFESCQLALSETVGETVARQERYTFLRDIVAKHRADGLMTAHHADDVIETIVLNLTRGTGWRGLSSLRSTPQVVRPLLAVPKKELITYALAAGLEWQEDATNRSPMYTRNHIRLRTLPALRQQQPGIDQTLRRLWQDQCRLRSAIEAVLDELTAGAAPGGRLLKHALLSLESQLAVEVLRTFLLAQQVRQTRPQLTRALAFARTAGNGKYFSLGRHRLLKSTADALVVVNG